MVKSIVDPVDHRRWGKGQVAPMSEKAAYIVSGALGMLAVMLVVALIFMLVNMRRNRKLSFDAEILPSGARLLSRAKYRGRRVAHYSDGSVIAETRRGPKAFESFDAYRYFVDRR